MRRSVLVACAVTAVVTFTGLDAQSRPDFSGTWTLVSSTPIGSHAMGTEFKVVQNGSTLTIDLEGIAARYTSGRSVQTAYPVRNIYALDGLEHPPQVVSDPPLMTTATLSAETMKVASVSSESTRRATWAGGQIVVMMHNTYKVTAPTRTPSEATIRQTVRQAFSLGPDGSLSVESLVVADPIPWGGDFEQPSPTPVRSVYRKKS